MKKVTGGTNPSPFRVHHQEGRKGSLSSAHQEFLPQQGKQVQRQGLKSCLLPPVSSPCAVSSSHGARVGLGLSLKSGLYPL